jgi:phosphatidylglycerol---prolipoprotein diacylglyceryl transferase
MTIFSISLWGIAIAPTYYGLSYGIGVILALWWLERMDKKIPLLSASQREWLFGILFVSIVLGGRIGYVLAYNLPYYLANAGSIFAFRDGGMSFHGGLTGVVVSTYFFCRYYKIEWMSLTDRLSIIAPWALAIGRFTNYLNNEMPGYMPYSGPWPIVREGIAHFPSPLLSMALE